MNATAAQAMIPSTFVSESSSFCSGDRVRVTEVSIVAIWPISVSIPVAVTTIVAVPRVTAVFWKTMFERSPSADVAAGERAGVLADRGALAGQRRLLRLERRGADDAAVGGDDVAGLELDDVARHDVDGRHERDAAVAHDLRLRHLHVRERVDALARLQLLARAEDEVEHDQEADETAVETWPISEAHDRDRDQHEVHRVAQLLQCDLRRSTAAARS